MVAFSQMKSVITISFVLAGVNAGSTEAPRDTPLTRLSERAQSLKPLEKKLVIATGVGVATGGAAGGMGFARGEKNETEWGSDLASIDSIAFNPDEGDAPPQLDIQVMTRSEATEAGIEMPDILPGAESIDGQIFYAQDDALNQTRAELLQTQLYDQGIIDNLEVNELEGFDFGDHDLVIIRDVDPTSIGQTFGMICLLGLGMLAILFTLLVVRKGNYDNKQVLAYVGMALGVGAASILGGFSLHFLSANNIGGMTGCAIGFGLTVILLAWLINSTRREPLQMGKVIAHVIGGAALLGGCAMLTNIAGEAVGENVIIKIRQTIIDPTDIHPEAVPSTDFEGMSLLALAPLGMLFVGFLWFFYAFFQNDNNPAFKGRIVALLVGASLTSAAVVGGSQLIAMDLAIIGLLPLFLVPAIMYGMYWILSNKKALRCGRANEVNGVEI